MSTTYPLTYEDIKKELKDSNKTAWVVNADGTARSGGRATEWSEGYYALSHDDALAIAHDCWRSYYNDEDGLYLVTIQKCWVDDDEIMYADESEGIPNPSPEPELKDDYYIIKIAGNNSHPEVRKLNGAKKRTEDDAAHDIVDAIMPHIVDGGLAEYPRPNIGKETLKILIAQKSLKRAEAENLAEIIGERYTSQTLEDCLADYKEEYGKIHISDSEKIQTLIDTDLYYDEYLWRYIVNKRSIDYDGGKITIHHEAVDGEGNFYEIDDETGDATLI